MEMGYLTVLYIRLGAKIGNLHTKDSHSFYNRLIKLLVLTIEPPTHVSSRANKGQNRKHILSTTSPTQASKRTPKRPSKQTLKKALNHQVRHYIEPPRQLPLLIFIKSSPPQLEQLEEPKEEEEPEEELKEELKKELKEEEEKEEKEPKEQLKEQPEEEPEEEPKEELKELPISFISQ